MTNTCTTESFDAIALRRLKEETVIAKPEWATISAQVHEIVEGWAQVYNRLRHSERTCNYEIPEIFKDAHSSMIDFLIQSGTDILMLINCVEVHSTPPQDLTKTHDLLMKGLCALKITRGAFSSDYEESH